MQDQNPNVLQETLLSKTQKLLDRVLFICFAEDTKILPDKILEKAIESDFVTKWESLKGLFNSVDKGNPPANIPTLNGGLFKQDTELESLNISNDTIKQAISLSKWDFASELSVNILGHVFEQSISDLEEEKAKLKDENYDKKKGKRKKDGVFYTPEYITSYIVEEAVGGWLSDRKIELEFDKLAEITSTDKEFLSEQQSNWNSKNNNWNNKKKLGKPEKILKEKIENHIEKWHEYSQKLKSITILDPACGSGAFLVQVFDYLKNQWLEVNENLSQLSSYLGLGGAFYRVKKASNSRGVQRGVQSKNSTSQDFRSQDFEEITIEYRYKDVLQNNIYGVDVNYESVQITRLSLWLKTAHRKEVLTSLDDNIKVGNSLIDDEQVAGFYKDDNGVEQSLAFKWEREFPHVFEAGANKDEQGNSKEVAGDQIDVRQGAGSRYEEMQGGDKQVAMQGGDKQGASWQEESQAGFDVVIGNPPYVRQERFSNIKSSLEKKYSVYTGVADLYCYFYEFAYQKLSTNGRLGFITSNKWMRAKYGQPLRKLLKETVCIMNLIDLGSKVFDDAIVDSNVLIYKKQKPATDYEFIAGNNLATKSLFNNCNLEESCFNVAISAGEREIKAKMEKIGTPLKKWDVSIYRGILTGYNEAFITDTKTKEELCKRDPKSAEIIKPLLRGKDISRYSYKWAGLWLIFTRRGIDIEQYLVIKEYLLQFYDKIKPRELGDKLGRKPGSYKWYEIQDNIAYHQEFEKEKVVYPNMTKFLPFVYDNEAFYTNQKCFIITGKSIKYLVAILNSKLSKVIFRNYFPELMGGTRELSKVFFEKLPIPQIPEAEQQPFITLATKMLKLNQERSDLKNKFHNLIKAKSGNPEKHTSVKLSKKLQKYYELESHEFIKELEKLLKKQKLPATTLAKESEWLTHFETEKQKALAIKQEIDLTDHIINQKTYALYELTKEEIKIVEGNN